MRKQLQARRIVITGGSGGIGQCLAEEAARRGARLILAARSADKLRQLADRLTAQGGEVLAVTADVTSDADRRLIIDTAVRRFGGLDVLINNAGIGSFGHFAESSEAVLRQIMEVNFFAPAELIRLAIPFLRNGVQPAIVNVSSMCGRRGVPAWPEYSASKFALCGLTEALRGEMARFDIDVLLIVPGLTRTDLMAHLLRNEGRMKIAAAMDKGLTPEETAAGILEALVKNRTEVVLGWEARWILRVNRFLPRLVDRLMARRVRQLYRDEVEQAAEYASGGQNSAAAGR
ncbi:MAG TPA: SDR family oxidoreductase [Gemmataceae bacterium]|nr:SDR family oxidoreductase [Gemmataceae bacterium]